MLYYSTHISGPEAEWVAFIHGMGGSSTIWFKQVREFSKEFNVLLIDLRGHGKSKMEIYHKLKRYRFEVVGDEVIDVLDHLKIKQAHFIGISLGTIIIRELAERYPERIKSMILGGAVMRMNFKSALLLNTGNLVKSIMPYMMLYKFFAFIIMPKKRNREARLIFINEAKKLYQREFQRWFSLTVQLKSLLPYFRSKDCGVPTLYVMGEDDHLFLPSIKRLAEKHKSAKLHIIPTSGHVVNVDCPTEFNNLVIDYMKSLK